MSIKPPLLARLPVAVIALSALSSAMQARAELFAIKRTPDGSAIRLLDVRETCTNGFLSAMLVLQPEGKVIEGCWMLSKETSRFLIKWQGAPEPRGYGVEEFELQPQGTQPPPDRAKR